MSIDFSDDDELNNENMDGGMSKPGKADMMF
jgi:hypothetical protein